MILQTCVDKLPGEFRGDELFLIEAATALQRNLCSARSRSFSSNIALERIAQPLHRQCWQCRAVVEAMSLIGPKRRKSMSVRMSAVGVLSGLIVLALSLAAHDPERAGSFPRSWRPGRRAIVASCPSASSNTSAL